MFALQRRFSEATVPCTRDLFYEIVKSEAVKGTIDQARAAIKAGDRNTYDRLKRSLPGFMFMATFTPNKGKKGDWPERAWRNQASVRLNGLVMLDFDHIEGDLKEVCERFNRNLFDDDCATQILLVHVTPSGQGLRLVCKADPRRGNLADNQQYIALMLGMQNDAAVKNADRMSFACREEDILYINEEIFNYENESYDQMFGENYRRGTSAGTKVPAHHPHTDTGSTAGAADGKGSEGNQPDGHHVTLEKDAKGNYVYRGMTYNSIVEEWVRQHGEPVQGERHTTLLAMASALRYICDNNAANLRVVVRMAQFVKDMEQEGSTNEIDRVCDDVVERKMYASLPRGLRQVLSKVKGGDGTDIDLSLYQQQYNRLQPLLAPPYDMACKGVEMGNAMGAVFASGAMFCTLLTRCWYKHFDGFDHRMNPQVLIIGDPASGKSFADKLDRLIMEPVRAADRMGREAEAEYKEKQRERATSSKAQKGEALKRPEFCIRYLPSRTSNAVFYRRQQQAKEDINGTPMQLHLYTFDSELDANNTAQKSGSWIGKHDIELKAFQNEWTGVDYANGDSVNDIIQVFYNTVATGTPISLGHKFSLQNINDGLCSRVAIFRMMPTNFKMIERGNRPALHDNECRLRQLAYKFDKLSGELPISRLVDHVYSLCELSAFEAEASSDLVLDFLRKRAVFYAIWFTVPRIVARAIEEAEKVSVDENALNHITVTDEDLSFSTVIYDAVIYWQDYFFGQMLLDSWENANNSLKQRKYKTKSGELYAALPKTFNLNTLAQLLNASYSAAGTQAKRWCDAGYIKRVKQGEYEKLISTLP